MRQVLRAGEHRSPDGERARALREQAHFAGYLPILFRSPPGGISKVINAPATRANSASLAATRRAASARCRTSVYALC